MDAFWSSYRAELLAAVEQLLEDLAVQHSLGRPTVEMQTLARAYVDAHMVMKKRGGDVWLMERAFLSDLRIAALRAADPRDWAVAVGPGPRQERARGREKSAVKKRKRLQLFRELHLRCRER